MTVYALYKWEYRLFCPHIEIKAFVVYTNVNIDCVCPDIEIKPLCALHKREYRLCLSRYRDKTIVCLTQMEISIVFVHIWKC
jgi:hypothetical protein